MQAGKGRGRGIQLTSMAAKRVEGEVRDKGRGRGNQLPLAMAFKRARVQRVEELDLEKEVSNMNQDHAEEPEVLNEEPMGVKVKDKKQ